MADETVVAESSSAPAVETPSLEIPSSGTAEYAEWRMSGTLPEKKIEPKIADTAAADTGKDQATDAAGAEPANKQQEKPRRKPDAEARIKSLTDELKELRSKLEETTRPKQTPADSSPAKPATQTQTARTKPTPDATNPDGTAKYKTYEDYVEDLTDWKAEQKWQSIQREQSARQQATELQSKVDDARARYGDQLDAVLAPTVNRIMADPSVIPTIKAMLNDSEVLPDVLFTLGSDAKALDDFLKMPPGKQIRYLAAIESGIQAELSASARNDLGQFTGKTETPAKRGPESAPEPPLEIGNRGRAVDEPTRALKAIENGDANAFRSWKQAEDRKAMARRRGL